MKRIVVGLCLLALAVPAFSQTGSSYEASGDHYHVISEISPDHAQAIVDRMEAMFALYNRQFRFPVEDLDHSLRVRIFGTKSRFDSYLRRVIDETRDGFVYLHYNDVAKSELVGYYVESDALDRSMVHQSFIQYMRSFVPNPPLWLREGFAVYYEDTEYDSEFRTALFRENLGWLDTVKQMIAGTAMVQPIAMDTMLALSVDEARDLIDSFYPQAWAMVSFLLDSEEPEINRILWDSLSALEPTATLDENVAAVYREAFRWVDEEQLVADFVSYVSERRSFRGWVEHGVERYEAGDLEAAERAFVQALNLREDNHVPHYYLGLINYDRSNYGLAEFYYQAALDRGADEPITLYALGVNAYADNRFEEAISFLEMTVDRDPAYRERAENLLVRIRG